MFRRANAIAAALSLIALGASFVTANAIRIRSRRLYSSGQAKQKQGDYKGAIADFTKLLEINPQYARAYNERIAKNGLKDYLGVLLILPRQLRSIRAMLIFILTTVLVSD